jgi:hypothetical protein
MKNAKLTLMFLACTAAIPAFAQNTTDSRCGTTNYDSSRNTFTIMHATPATPNQQCFVTVVSKDSWTGGTPNLATSQMVEGNYEISLSGGGGGGGGGADRAGAGGGGAGAVPFVTTQYLSPGVYRLTVGAGGWSGTANGGNGGDGAPTSLSNATTGQLIAGFPGAETWNGLYQRNNHVHDGSGGPAIGGQGGGGHGGHIGGDYKGQDGGRLVAVAYAGEPGKGGTDLAGHRMRHEVAGGGGGGAGSGNGGNGDSSAEDGKGKTGAGGGNMGAGGGGGAGGEHVADAGSYGGNGFIKLALKDPVVSAQPAPMQVAPATSSTQNYTAPAPAATLPARKSRN